MSQAQHTKDKCQDGLREMLLKPMVPVEASWGKGIPGLRMHELMRIGGSMEQEGG